VPASCDALLANPQRKPSDADVSFAPEGTRSSDSPDMDAPRHPYGEVNTTIQTQCQTKIFNKYSHFASLFGKVILGKSAII
jgi:hypothetical protein